jgi:hypothetical protein
MLVELISLLKFLCFYEVNARLPVTHDFAQINVIKNRDKDPYLIFLQALNPSIFPYRTFVTVCTTLRKHPTHSFNSWSLVCLQSKLNSQTQYIS